MLSQSHLLLQNKQNPFVTTIRLALQPYCNGVKDCHHLKEFAKIMNKCEIVNINRHGINDILNSYIHLIHQHNTDHEFEFIAACLDDCGLTKCQKFLRNHRDRNRQKQNDHGRMINLNA
eukprot:378726_1